MPLFSSSFDMYEAQTHALAPECRWSRTGRERRFRRAGRYSRSRSAKTATRRMCRQPATCHPRADPKPRRTARARYVFIFFFFFFFLPCSIQSLLVTSFRRRCQSHAQSSAPAATLPDFLPSLHATALRTPGCFRHTKQAIAGSRFRCATFSAKRHVQFANMPCYIL